MKKRATGKPKTSSLYPATNEAVPMVKNAEVSTDFRPFDGYFLRSETLYNLASENLMR